MPEGRYTFTVRRTADTGSYEVGPPPTDNEFCAKGWEDTTGVSFPPGLTRSFYLADAPAAPAAEEPAAKVTCAVPACDGRPWVGHVLRSVLCVQHRDILASLNAAVAAAGEGRSKRDNRRRAKSGNSRGEVSG